MTTPMNYVDPPDVPEGMTLAEYRRRTREGEPPKRRGLRRRARARSAARRAAAQRKAA
jgi:hypothetical protein